MRYVVSAWYGNLPEEEIDAQMIKNVFAYYGNRML